LMTGENGDNADKRADVTGGTVRGWLEEEGLFGGEVEDPKALFHFRVNYPPGSPFHIDVVKPQNMEDGLLIIAVLKVSPPHRERMAQVPQARRREMFFQLKMRLLQRRPVFSVKESRGLWEAVSFQLRILNDNLTKTSLLEAVDESFRSMLTVIWWFNHHLGTPAGQKWPGFYA